jgi:hypothetical protein
MYPYRNRSWLRAQWNRFRNWIDDIKRGFSGFWICYKTPDWDYGYILRLLAWKLRRVQKCMREDSMSVWTAKEDRKLQTAIILLDKLADDEYVLEDYLCELKLLGLPSKRMPKKYMSRRFRSNQDWDLLMKLLHSQMRKWWN